ncbi:helix-turn-helix transcriptional regulator [Paraflavitalea sp. CAU 1676]|uniref:helix-turn-helix domain-containing protein n=1 Tax=Paraflavitalea sp. CAU 1676 TaxID=3032598 RepID=UPI0023DA524C|nr:helix-turn-helix transcriptional regulator [Paraflavitalea sp. CAU 1676]MDF2191636.1 helix-turn-helix transcriptional regulator [Paraflavitalea sp. CAU 1676]
MSLLLLQPTLLSCMSLILCLTTGIILLTFSRTVSLSRALLASSFITMAISFLVGLLLMLDWPPVNTRWQKLPHLIWLLSIPLPFCYVRSFTVPKLSWKDLIHLLPFAIFLVDYLPFFSAPIDALSLTPAMGWERVHDIIPHERGLFLPASFHIPMITVIMTLYWILQVHRLVIYSEQQPRPSKDRLWWLSLYTILQSLVFLPSLIAMIINRPNDWVLVVPPTAVSILSCFILFLCPGILYDFALKTTVKEDPPRHKPLFDDESAETLSNRLTQLMSDKKPYLNGNYSLQELAAELDMQPHRLSSFINNVTGKNFNEYLNHQRIAFCLELIAKEETDHLNINGLAALCGFNNRNTFSTAFKKVTGQNPSEFLRNRSDGPRLTS